MSTLIIICLKCQMEFTFSQIIGLWMIFQPGKLQFKIRGFISHIYYNEGTILCFLPAPSVSPRAS